MSKLGRSLINAANEARGITRTQLQIIKDQILDVKDDILNFIYYRPINRLEILTAYLKQGWKANDYDWCYLLSDMQFKLHRMAKLFTKNDRLESSKQNVIEIMEIIHRLEVLKDMEFHIGQKYQKMLEDEFGKLRWFSEQFSEDGSKICLIVHDKLREDPSLKDKYDKRFKELMKLEYKEKQDYKRKTFQLLSKYLEGWWD